MPALTRFQIADPDTPNSVPAAYNPSTDSFETQSSYVSNFHIKYNDPIEKILEIDTDLCNSLIDTVCDAFTRVTEPKEVHNLVKSALDVIQTRRQLALRPTRAADSKNKADDGFVSLD